MSMFFFFLAIIRSVTCHQKKCVYEIYNYGKIVFLFHYVPVRFQFIIASQHQKCMRSDTNRSTVKHFSSLVGRMPFNNVSMPSFAGMY